jgi:hypothetical protein
VLVIFGIMDVTILLEPAIDLKRLAEILDGLGHEGRVHTIRSWSKRQKIAIFEAAKGFMPIDIDFLVPSSVGPLVEVIHYGHNTLPLFSTFQKRFVRLEGDEYPAAGYNHQAMEPFTGPGYFVVKKGEGEHEGELVLDHTKVPKHKAPSWPALRPNEGLIGGPVHGSTVDYLRGLSTHVSIGVALDPAGKPRGSWFALVRKDPD